MAKPTIPSWEAVLRGIRHHCRTARLYYARADGVPSLWDHGHGYEVRGLIGQVDDDLEDAIEAGQPDERADNEDDD